MPRNSPWSQRHINILQAYVYGCLRELRDHSFEAPPLDIHIALRRLFNLPLDDVAIAQLGQRAEIRYAGVNCGIRDQMASSLADTRYLADTITAGS